MIAMRTLEVLGGLRSFGLTAQHVGENVLLAYGPEGACYSVHVSGGMWVVRGDAGTLASMPEHWSAEAVAAAVVCVAFLGASSSVDEVAA